VISTIVVSLPDAHRVVGEVDIAVVAFFAVSYRTCCLGAFPRNNKNAGKDLQKSERRLVHDNVARVGRTYISAFWTVVSSRRVDDGDVGAE
jgi:hypothetical protein